MSTDNTGNSAGPLSDPALEEQIRLGERTAEATDRANGRTLDRLLDGQNRTFLDMGALALDDTFRELLRKDPT